MLKTTASAWHVEHETTSAVCYRACSAGLDVACKLHPEHFATK